MYTVINYTKLDNKFLQENLISLKAKGFYLFLKSFEKDNRGVVYVEMRILRAMTCEPLATLHKLFNELEQAGMLIVKRFPKNYYMCGFVDFMEFRPKNAPPLPEGYYPVDEK